MGFGLNDRNKKLNANEVCKVFRSLNQDPEEMKIVGKDIPISGWLAPYQHLQGIAVRKDYAVVTSSTQDGYILTGKKGSSGACFCFEKYEPLIKSAKCSPVKQTLRRVKLYAKQFLALYGVLDHPGGIQTIGDWVVVPVEGNDPKRSEIRFYKYKGKISLVKRLTICRTPALGKAGSVGITDYASKEGQRYLLATCPNSKHIHFYWTEANVPLSNCGCFFKGPTKWWSKGKNALKGKWENYVNGISLVADCNGNIFFMGLYGKPKFKFWPMGFKENYADLYKVKLKWVGGKLKTVRLEKISHKMVKCKGTSFRWGGSALVTSPTAIRLFACSWKVQGWFKKKKKIRVNIFS